MLSLSATIWLGACGATSNAAGANSPAVAPQASPVPAALAQRGTPIAQVLTQVTATPIVAPTADPSSPDVLATAMAGPDVATAIAIAATAEAETAALLPLSPEDQALTFDASNVSHYSWTIIQAPDAARASVGTVLKQGDDQQVALDLDQVEQFFPAPGTYTLRLTLVDKQGQVSERDFDLMI